MAEQLDIGAPVRALYAAIDQQDEEALRQVLDENIEFVDYGLGEAMKGRDGVVNYFKSWWVAFPLGSGEITSLMIQGDVVVIEAAGRGNQAGDFNLSQCRFTASHQDLEFHFAKFCQIRDGKILSIHGYSNAFQVLSAAEEGQQAAAA